MPPLRWPNMPLLELHRLDQSRLATLGRWFLPFPKIFFSAKIERVCFCRQYLAILYENWPLEIWDARKLVLLKVFSQQNFRPVALVGLFLYIAWTYSPDTVFALVSALDLVKCHHQSYVLSAKVSNSSNRSIIPFSGTAGDKLLSPDGGCITDESYSRETFILCTSPLTLQLFTMEGSNVDAMPISSTMWVIPRTQNSFG